MSYTRSVNRRPTAVQYTIASTMTSTDPVGSCVYACMDA